MKSLPFDIRHPLVCLIALIAGVMIGFCHVLPAEAAEVPTPSLMQRLRVPEPSDEWRIDAFIRGYPVKLSLPRESARIGSFPPRIQRLIRKRMEFRQRNIEVLRSVVQMLEAKIAEHGRPVRHPAHSGRLERVVISIPPIGRSGSYGSALELHKPVLAALPDHTEVDFFLPEDAVPLAAHLMKEIEMEDRVKLHGVKVHEFAEDGIRLRYHTTRWTRDIFWPVTDRTGRTQLLLPLAFYQINDLSRPDNDYIERLDDDDLDIVRVPLFFKGGNLFIGEIGGRRILFIGQDELELNRDFYYNAFFYHPPQEEVLGLFKLLSGADEVRVLPNSKHLFHLDMAMSFVKPGTAALLDPVDGELLDKEDQHVIRTIHQALSEYGFRIVKVPTLADWVVTYKSPVNVIPFTNRGSNRLTAIIPQWEDRKLSDGIKPDSINQRIRQAYEHAGIKQIFAVGHFHHLNGNFHCAVLPVK